MTLAEQWRALAAQLPEHWSSARVTLRLAENERADRAALILGPLSPGRTSSVFRFTSRPGADPARVLRRLDEEGIRGRLDVVEADQPVEPRRAPPVAPRERARPLAEQWDELVARLPEDWSDIYAEVELDSTDYLQRGALLLAPVNPAHYGGATTLRFRAAQLAGYGVAASMARRCLERVDEEEITGRLRILRVLSATRHVATQGPVWRVGGRSV